MASLPLLSVHSAKPKHPVNYPRASQLFPAGPKTCRLKRIYFPGQLPLMLRCAMAAATLLEPLLIVGLAVVVLLIMLAVLMPIMQLKPWVR